MRKTKTSKLTLQTETLKDLQLKSAVGGGGFYIVTQLCVSNACTGGGSGTSVINPSGGSQNPSGG